MTSASSRRSFYHLPPSVYPTPLVDPCSAFETTYAHNHCKHSIQDEEFFRTRTLNPSSTARQLATSQRIASGARPQTAQGIYSKHATGQFTAPYFRRDSKGYRRPFEQPPHVDDHYSQTKDLSGLVVTGLGWAHPSSRPTYAASNAPFPQGSGAVFTTSYRNSGQFDSTSNHTSRVTREVANELQNNRSQALAASMAPHRAFNARPQSAHSYLQPKQQQQQQQPQYEDFGYYTNEQRDSPPRGAEVYTEYDYPKSNFTTERSQSAARLAETQALVTDPTDNKHRRAVYNRSFGRF